MQNDVLLPEIESMMDGQGPVVDAEPLSCQVLTLGITQTLEREQLDVSIWGSADGEDWGSRPLAEFSGKSYCGVYSLTLDLGRNPAIKLLRAAWKMRTWPRREAAEPREPLFGFYVRAQPSPTAR